MQTHRQPSSHRYSGTCAFGDIPRARSTQMASFETALVRSHIRALLQTGEAQEPEARYGELTPDGAARHEAALACAKAIFSDNCPLFTVNTNSSELIVPRMGLV